MSSAKAYKGYKRRKMALERKGATAPKPKEESGLLKRKMDSGSSEQSGDMVEVIDAYIKAIRDL